MCVLNLDFEVLARIFAVLSNSVNRISHESAARYTTTEYKRRGIAAHLAPTIVNTEYKKRICSITSSFREKNFWYFSGFASYLSIGFPAFLS